MAFSIIARPCTREGSGVRTAAALADITTSIPIILIFGALGLNGTYNFSAAASYAAIATGGLNLLTGTALAALNNTKLNCCTRENNAPLPEGSDNLGYSGPPPAYDEPPPPYIP